MPSFRHRGSPSECTRKDLYDFCLDDHWSFLDIETQQFYLDFDNETLVSSEEVMDDPFLVLRTKHLQKNEQMNLKQGWQALAHFDILNPVSAKTATLFPCEWIERAEGFRIHPSESILLDLSPIETNMPPMNWGFQNGRFRS